MPGGSLQLPEPQSWVGAAAGSAAAAARLCYWQPEVWTAPHPADPSSPEPWSPGAQGVGEAHSSGTAGPGHARKGK